MSDHHYSQQVIEFAVADIIALPGVRSAVETAQRAVDHLADHNMPFTIDDVLIEVVLQLGGAE